MSATLPEVVDAWRLVSQRRCFEGKLPLARFERLRGSLVDAEGTLEYALEFGRDEFGVGYIEIDARCELPLLCQRTLERFLLPVHVHQRLGLIGREADEAGLPPGYEALLAADGQIRPADLVEDELILALPLVPVKPDAGGGASRDEADPAPIAPDADGGRRNPFAVLQALKKN